MERCIPLPLSNDQLFDVIEKARDFALCNGLCMRSRTNFDKNNLQFAPFVLFPSSFPRKEYEYACNMQIILNKLMHAVANDHEFLKESLKDTVEVDDFTRKLFDIYDIVYEEGMAQDVSLTLLRSDLMLDSVCPKQPVCEYHEPYCCWKQVEINTIASGHGWMGPSCTKLHRYVLEEIGMGDKVKNLPENKALKGLCSGIIEAWKMYNETSAVILFVLEDTSYNICDQRFHEYEIRKLNPSVKVIRRTLTELVDAAKLGSSKELIVNNYIVAVVYFRSGYAPNQYHTENEWNVRLLIERSLAIKCPSIQYHLAGTKKVQQALAKPGIVPRLLKNSKDAKQVKEIFTGLYSLDFDEQGDAALEMAIENPQNFVLKPQREGGCNNLFGKDIRNFLESIRNKRKRSAWILMDRICPPVQTNYMIRPQSDSNMELKELVSELGIFGILLGDSKKIFVNKQVGHTLRTKLATADEGGVASGLGACDSPYLID